MNRTSRKPKIVLIALLLVVALFCGVMSLATPTTAVAEDKSNSLTTVREDWFEVAYDKDNLEIRLSDNYREYLEAERGDFTVLKNALVAAFKEIAMKSILNSNDEITEPNTIMYSTILPFAAPIELPPDCNPGAIDWNDNELLKSFRDYVKERLSEPEEFNKYLNGEYNTLLEYAIGEYVQNNGGENAGNDIYQKIEEAIEGVVEEAMDNVVDKLIEREILEQYEEGGEKEGQTPPTPEQLKELVKEKKKDPEAVKAIEEQKNEWKDKSKDVVQSTAGAVQENGGKAPSIDLNTIIDNLKSLTINGKEIYVPGTLHMEGVRQVLALIPSPAEIAVMNKEALRNLISADICINTTFGSIDFKLTFGFYGDSEIIQKTAKLFADHINVVKDGNNYSVSVKMPDAFGKALSAFYASGRFSNETKNKVFGFFGKTVTEIEDKIQSFTFEEVLDFFKGVDYRAWLNDLVNGDFINTYFGNYFEQVFGKRLTAEHIDRVINAFSDKMAEFASRKLTYADAHDFLVKNVPGFSRLAASIDETRLESLVNKLLNIINRIDWKKYNAAGVRDILANSETFNDTVVSYIEKFADYGDVYDTFMKYVEKAFGYLPENIKNGAIIDLYDGNGAYSHYGEYTLDFEKILNKISSVLKNRGFDKFADLAKNAIDALEQKSYTFNLSFDMNINNVYKVEYFVGNETEKELAREGLLTDGADVELFARPDVVEEKYDVLYWMDIDKNEITEMPAEDTALYAVTDFSAKGYIDDEETTELTATYDAQKEYTLKVVPDGVSYAEYDYQWFFNGEPIEDANTDTFVVSKVSDSGEYTVSITDKFTGLERDFEKFTVKIEKQEVSFKLAWTIADEIGEYEFDGSEKARVRYSGYEYEVSVDFVACDPEVPAMNELVEATLTGASTGSAKGEYSVEYELALLDEENYKFADDVQTTGKFEWEIFVEGINVEVSAKLTPVTEGSKTQKPITYVYDSTQKEVDWSIEHSSAIEGVDLPTDFDFNKYFVVEKLNTTRTNAGRSTAEVRISVNTEYADQVNLFVDGKMIDEPAVFSEVWVIEKAKLSVKLIWDYDAEIEHLYNGKELTVRVKEIRITAPDIFVNSTAGLFDIERVMYSGDERTQIMPGEYHTTADVKFTLKSLNFEIIKTENATLDWSIVATEIKAPTNTWGKISYNYKITKFVESDIVYTGIEDEYKKYFEVSPFRYTRVEADSEVDVTADDLNKKVGKYKVYVDIKFIGGDGTILSNNETEFTFSKSITIDIYSVSILADKWNHNGVTYDKSKPIYYDGNKHEFTYVFSGVTVPQEMKDAIVYTYTKEGSTDKLSDAPVEVGKYTVSISIKAELADIYVFKFYTPATGILNFEIKQATAAAPEVTFSEPTKVGEEYVVTVGGEYDSQLLDREISGETHGAANVDHVITVTFTLKNSNYTFTGTEKANENDIISEDGKTYTVKHTWKKEEVAPSQKYTITVQCDTNKGSYELDPNENEYETGAQVKLTVTPAANYEVESVMANGSELEAQDGKYTITVGTENIQVVINFKEKVVPSQKYTITVDCDTNKGSYELDPNESEYETGAQVKLTVTPAANYAVKSVTANGSELEAQDGKYTITVGTENIQVVITFRSLTVEDLDISGAKWTVNGEDYNGESLVYDGRAVNFGLAGLSDEILEKLSFEYTNANGDKLEGAPTDAGTYTVKVVAAEGYELVYDEGFEVSIEFVIDKYVPIKPEIEVDITLESARGKVVVNLKFNEHLFYTYSDPVGTMESGIAGTYTFTYTYTVVDKNNIMFGEYAAQTYNSNNWTLVCTYEASEDGSELYVTATWVLDENVERSFNDEKNHIVVIDENNTLPESITNNNLKTSMEEADLDNYIDELKTQYPDKSTRYGSAYDISFADADGNKIEAPAGSKFRVRIPLPERLASYKAEDLAVMHIMDGDEIEYLPVLGLVDVEWVTGRDDDGKATATETVKCVEFEVSSFSMFVVIGLEQLPDSVGDWWLIVLLCVLGVLVILAVVFFILKARKNNGDKVEENPETEASSESAIEASEGSESDEGSDEKKEPDGEEK